MTQFDITYTDFKREDTTNDITIKLYADNKRPIIPDASHTWKAKVAKDDKYVGEYPVTILGNTIKLSSSNLTRLPDGNYALELWETYDGSTAIYPSTGVMTFRVNKNLDDTLGTIDPTTDINAIIDDLHKAGQNIKVVATNTLPAGSKASVTQSIANGENQLTFNIPQGDKGDKGDKGDVGPAPTLKVGTVTKLNPDQAPTVALTGGDGTYTLNMGIPQGIQGDKGDPGFYHYTVDLTDAKYDRNKWYYVESNSYPHGSLGGPSYFSLEAPLDATTVPYGKHGSGSVCARQTVLYGRSDWGSYGRKLIVLDDQNPTQWTTDGKRLLTFAVPSDNNLNYAFYARGGLKINITSDVSGLTWTPHTDTFVENNTTISVLNDVPDPKALGLNDGHTFWALPMSQLKQQLKPVKGTDYWTDADKQAILDETKQYADDAIENGEW